MKLSAACPKTGVVNDRWHGASKLLFLACWTEPVFDTERSWSQHLSPDEPDICCSLFGCCSSLLSLLLVCIYQIGWNYFQLSDNLESCDLEKSGYFELQNKNQKASRFQWQLKIINLTCTVFAVFVGEAGLSFEALTIRANTLLVPLTRAGSIEHVCWKSGEQANSHCVPVMCRQFRWMESICPEYYSLHIAPNQWYQISVFAFRFWNL